MSCSKFQNIFLYHKSKGPISKEISLFLYFIFPWFDENLVNLRRKNQLLACVNNLEPFSYNLPNVAHLKCFFFLEAMSRWIVHCILTLFNLLRHFLRMRHIWTQICKNVWWRVFIRSVARNIISLHSISDVSHVKSILEYVIGRQWHDRSVQNTNTLILWNHSMTCTKQGYSYGGTYENEPLRESVTKNQIISSLHYMISLHPWYSGEF